MDTKSTEEFKAPYMSFHTFWNFIAELGNNPLPPRIDRSIMTGKSGTDQANLFMALTSFGLIDQEATVLPLLDELTSADQEQRKAILSNLVTANYAEPMRISASNGTSKDLDNAFRDSYPSIASPDTRRKAVTFFLHAAKTAGLELSVHFPTTRSGPGAPGTSKPRKAARRKPAPLNSGTEKPLVEAPGAPAAGDTYRFDLRSGGTIFAVVDVNIFQLDKEDRDYVIGLVDKLKGYPTGSNKNGPSEEGPSGQPSGDGGGVTPT